MKKTHTYACGTFVLSLGTALTCYSPLLAQSTSPHRQPPPRRHDDTVVRPDGPDDPNRPDGPPGGPDAFNGPGGPPRPGGPPGLDQPERQDTANDQPAPEQDEDHGRPVALIARDLGVTPEQFRAAFRKVHPAGAGQHPTEAQRQANRKVLSETLGVAPERLDAIMDKYRPGGRGDNGPERPQPEVPQSNAAGRK